jgi:uncharacterized delta-60 repeat protein
MIRQRWATWILVAAAAGAAACGDDTDAILEEDVEQSDAGEKEGGSSGSGGKSGSNTSSGEGESEEGGRSAASGGSGGSGGSRSSDDKEEQGAGGSKSGSGGRGGSSGSGSGGSGSDDSDAGVESPYPAIEKVGDSVVKQANDLRGLTYSASGKIWASGHTDADANNRKLVLARFNADGTPDTSFADNGFLVYDVRQGDEQSMGLVELENGDVVVQANVSDGKGGAAVVDSAGGPDGMRANGSDVTLLRFTSSGELVTSFGEEGIAKVTFGWAPSDDQFWPAPTYNSAAAMENQRYSHAGFPTDQAWGVLLDKSSGEEKLVLNGFGAPTKVDSNQRLDNDRFVVRVLASTGEIDPDFNGGKPFTFHSEGTLSDGGRRALVEPDGSIVSSGYTNFGEGQGNHVILARLKPDGTPDSDFGFGRLDQPGLATFNPFLENGGVAECYNVVKTESGRYVTTGYGRATAANQTSKFGYATSDGPDLVAFAVKGDGTEVDTGWGIDGTRAIQSEEAGLGGTEDRGRDLVALKDGRTVHVGRYGTGPAIFVVTPDGELDVGSGNKGIISYTPFAEMPSHFFAAALSPDGKSVAATTNNHAEGVIVAVIKVSE